MGDHIGELFGGPAQMRQVSLDASPSEVPTVSKIVLEPASTAMSSVARSRPDSTPEPTVSPH